MKSKNLLLFVLFLAAVGFTILYGLTIFAMYIMNQNVGIEIIIGFVIELLAILVLYKMYKTTKHL